MRPARVGRAFAPHPIVVAVVARRFVRRAHAIERRVQRLRARGEEWHDAGPPQATNEMPSVHAGKNGTARPIPTSGANYRLRLFMTIRLTRYHRSAYGA